MGFWKELKSTGEQLLSTLYVPRGTVNRTVIGKNTGVISQQPEAFVGEIRDAQDNHFAWVRADGGWDTSTPLTLAGRDEKGNLIKNKSGGIAIVNDTDHSFEAMKALWYPYAPSCGN